MNAAGRTEGQPVFFPDGLPACSTDFGEPEAVAAPVRLLSLDALRGFVMLALASGGFGLTAAARHFPGNPVWQFLAGQCKHAPWIGCSFADLLQPIFLFIVGAALPVARANRRRQGQDESRIAWRAVRRAATFLVLGVLFEANKSGGMAISFVNVLAQIGLGYVFVALLARSVFSHQLLAVSVILIGNWLVFTCYPLSDSAVVDARGRASASTANLSSGRLTGFFAHWNKHDNVAAAFDRRFLNLFPRSKPFVRQTGGYQTLNFIPSMATMLLGVLAGQLLLSPRTPSRKLALLLAAALLSWQSGMILSWTICPCVKRLWTPTWVLVSGGGAFLALALFYWLIDVRHYRRWCLPLAGIGRTTLALYGAFGVVQFVKPLVPPAAWHCLDIFLESLPTASHAVSILIWIVKVYTPLALTASLVLLLWKVGGRIYRRQPCIPSSSSDI
ncbi:MAG: acyltransferase family protein [Gemmataceae bacterium]